MNAIIRQVPSGLAIAAQSRSFWERVNPGLAIDARPARPAVTLSSAAERDCLQREEERWRLASEGYLKPAGLGLAADWSELAAAVTRLVEFGLPPAALGIYDPFWDLARAGREIAAELLGEPAAMVPDWWVEFAQPGDPGSRARRPWSGHLDDEGRPGVLQLWVPITPSSPESGALAVVCAREDRGYREGAPALDAPLQAIRMVPALPGEVVALSGQSWSWRAGSSEWHEGEPMIAVRLTFQRASLAPVAGATVDLDRPVTLARRLHLFAEQLPVHGRAYMADAGWRLTVRSLINRFSTEAEPAAPLAASA